MTDALEPLTERHILPSSHITSDGWAPYANIGTIRNSIYMHSIIVHQRNFVDPHDSKVHTEKLKICGCMPNDNYADSLATALFLSYLHEFMYRNELRGQDLFCTFLMTIADNYPLDMCELQ